MAETAKLMNPKKKVLIPDMQAGCSLASSITGEDVRMLKEKYPGVPVVSYVNTSADVKAETDICCTSANAIKVVESLGVDKVIFLPDHYLANYVQKNTKVKIISWQGTCIVHEKFTGKEIEDIRKENMAEKKNRRREREKESKKTILQERKTERSKVKQRRKEASKKTRKKFIDVLRKNLIKKVRKKERKS